VIATVKPSLELKTVKYFIEAKFSLRKAASSKELNEKNVMHVYVILNPEVLHFLCWQEFLLNIQDIYGED